MCIYNLTLEHTLKELCSHVCQKICIRMFIIALFEMLETRGKMYICMDSTAIV